MSYIPKYIFLILIFSCFCFSAKLSEDIISNIKNKFILSSHNNLSLNEELKKENPLLIARKMDWFLNWISDIEESEEKILIKLAERYNSFNDTSGFLIEKSVIKPYGNKEAPVELVAYTTASCKICEKVVKEVKDEISDGKLRNKVKLIIKPFGSGIGDIGSIICGKDEKYWTYFEELGKVKTRLTKAKVIEAAVSAGYKRDEFEGKLFDPEYKKILLSYKREGYKNNVSVTPVFFINNKRYKSYKDAVCVIDAVLYEYEMIKP